MKSDKRTQDIPVIIVTVSTRNRDIAECRRLGAQDYIVKPVGFQNFSVAAVELSLGWTLVKRNRVYGAQKPTNFFKKKRTLAQKSRKASEGTL
jgi:CheY-like chemotaxis protein